MGRSSWDPDSRSSGWRVDSEHRDVLINIGLKDT